MISPSTDGWSSFCMILGHFKPGLYSFVFPSTGNLPIVLETVTTLGVVFFLLTAGLEIDLRSIFRQGRSAILVSSLGVVIPFAIGFGAAELFPHFLGAEVGANTRIFALFLGTARSTRSCPEFRPTRVGPVGRWDLFLR
jgi:Kef-type K+ transport system membrane component KefB